MHAKNKIRRYYNLIKNFSNWRQYLFFKIFSKKDSFNFKLRNSFNIDVPKQTLSAFKESFFDEIYIRNLPEGVLKEEEMVVIDIGANIGYFSLFIFFRFPKARVYAFEPMPYNYALLEQSKKKYVGFKFFPANKAISDSNSAIELHASKLDGYTTMASIFNSPGNSHTIKVDAMTLVDAMNQNDLERIDLLKLDCEGAEYAILYNLSKDDLEKISAMCIETHMGKNPDENTLSLKTYLERHQFKTVCLDEEKTGYIWAWKTDLI